MYSLVKSGTLSLVAGEPGEDIAVVPGPQRRGGGGSIAVSGPDKGKVKGEETQEELRSDRYEKAGGKLHHTIINVIDLPTEKLEFKHYSACTCTRGRKISFLLKGMCHNPETAWD